ncbi:oligosaccharide flippase family protein [Vibrio vulnificus]|uniref:oligosaccharide flippase family protein n=1 Tax=Vibrio vulnificus TaxID=672 RepID=UPI00215D4EEA|nr:oligosaccharide flippase family protein [Vibrio vulnificus]MCR9703234.1 oligosaccharide flippase family protein [Vibrio vulnificus]
MLKNILALGFSTSSKLMINAGLLIILAKYLGVENYGILATSIALTSICVITFDFGFSTYIIKVVADDKSLVHEVNRKAIALKIYLLLIYVVFCQLVSYFIIETEYKTAFNLVMIMTLLNSIVEFVYISFRSISKFKIEAKVSLISSFIHLFTIIPIAYLYQNLLAVVCSYIFAKSITLLICFGEYKKEFERFDLPSKKDIKLKSVINVLNQVKYYGFDSAIINIRSNIDTVIIKALLGYESVGIYQAGVNIVKALERIGPILANVYLPKLSKLDFEFKKYFFQLIAFMIITPTIITVIAINVDFKVILGQDFSILNQLMPLFMLYMVLRYICMSFGVFITAVGLQKLRVKFGLINLMFSIGAFFILIPMFDILGAVSAMILTAIVLLFCFLSVVIKEKHYLVRV